MKLTKTIVKQYLNKVLFGNAKVKRISTFNKDCIIFEVKLNKGNMLFCPTCCRVQSISYHTDTLSIIYTITSNEYKYIETDLKYYNLI